MSTMREFDVQCRGVAMLVEDWEARHTAVRQLWKVEDLLKLVMDAIAAAVDVYDSCQKANPGQQSLADQLNSLAYLLRRLEQLMSSANLIEDRVSLFQSEGYAVADAEMLRQDIVRLSAIIHAARASLEDAQWQELDQQALSTRELLEVRDYLRTSGQASA